MGEAAKGGSLIRERGGWLGSLGQILGWQKMYIYSFDVDISDHTFIYRF